MSRALDTLSMRPFAQLEHDLNIRGHFKNKTIEDLYADAYTVDGTSYLLLELVLSGQPMTQEDFNHSIVPTYGPTGSGKSTLVQKEVTFLRRVIYHDNHIANNVHVTWSPLQTISRLRYGQVHDLDTFYQDEHRKGRIGQGSATNDWLLQQAEETLRANGNSFFFCSPSPREHVPHWIQETIGFNKTTGFNDCYILGPRYRKPICVAHLGPAFTIDPLIKATYIRDKKAYNKSIKRGGGWVGELDPEIEQFSFDELFRHLRPNMTRSDIENQYIQLGLFPGFYMDRIVARATSELRRLNEENREKSRQTRIEELARIDLSQKELFSDVCTSIIKYLDDLGLKKRPLLGAIKHEARTRGIDKGHMGLFTDYFLAQWTVKEAKQGSAEERSTPSGDELVDRGTRAEIKGHNEELRWQNKYKSLLTNGDKLIRAVKPNNGKRSPPAEPDLRVWTTDGGLWIHSVKYRQDYHNSWIPFYLESGEERACPEFRVAKTITLGAEKAGAKLRIIDKEHLYAVLIDRNGAEEDWIPPYVIVPFAGQVAANEFFVPVNFIDPTTRGLELQEVDEFFSLDTPATSYLKGVLRNLPLPKGQSVQSPLRPSN